MFLTMVGAAMAKTVRSSRNDELVVRARTDAKALGELYEMYYERVFRFCVHRLFSKEIAEDITSTVFLEVARGMRGFAGRTERDFRSWLYTIAVNQVNAYIRKSSRRRRLLSKAAESIAASSAHPDGSRRFDWPRLYAALMKLRPEHQTIITLRFFENLHYDEIARIMGMQQSTARVRLHRVLQKLRKQLQKSFEEQA